MEPSPEANSSHRPVIYDYGAASEFLRDLLAHYKATGRFSSRQRAAKGNLCSQALISRILNGQRQLTRSNLPAVAAVLKLTQAETNYLDQKLLASSAIQSAPEQGTKTKAPREPKNHLLTHWLNPYVKDLIHLKGFSLDPEKLYVMLKGIAPARSIQKSVDFLLREGFWRRAGSSQVVPEDTAVVTTHGISNQKVRDFHKKALAIAIRGIATLPPEQRRASTVLLSVNNEDLQELKDLVDSFQSQLLKFIEEHPDGKDSLVQVAVHLTPIGEKTR